VTENDLLFFDYDYATPLNCYRMMTEMTKPNQSQELEMKPLTKKDFARMKRVPRVKIIREALQLTQEEFAARYHIPIGTLRDWEQERKEPDQTARAYLRVVAREPEVVRRALEKSLKSLQR
jgi:putative transcriptional regulator